jgi:four helix bundle protein
MVRLAGDAVSDKPDDGTRSLEGDRHDGPSSVEHLKTFVLLSWASARRAMRVFMKTRHFRDLLVWRRSMALARSVYTATELLPKSEMFGLVSQIRRSAVSVPSNIAEGHGRLTDKLFALFLGQARGSLYELQTQVELAGNLEYLSPETVDVILQEAAEIARMLNGLLSALQTDRDRQRASLDAPGDSPDAVPR